MPSPPSSPTVVAAIALTVQPHKAARRATPGPTMAAVALTVRVPQAPQRAAPQLPRGNHDGRCQKAKKEKSRQESQGR